MDYLMCGFAGILNYPKNLNLDKELSKYSSLLKHRGPDAEGFLIKDDIIACHRRLAIVDNNQRSNQPFISNCENYTLIYNGEVYNFQELKEELLSLGIKFFTDSDTEVFLNGFIFWGNDFFTKANGMFAVAIWDEKNRKLTLARDRLGIKPLYISNEKESFYFSSEIKPILHSRNETFINYEKIGEYFKFRYIKGNKTAFKDINCFPPGHILEIQNNEFKYIKYWCLKPNQNKEPLSSNKIKKTLVNAITSRLKSYASIASYLSEGIDSSSILYIAQTKCPNKISATYTYDTEDESSEFLNAKKFSNELNCKNIKVTQNYNYNDIGNIISSLEEPIGDNIIIPSFDLAREVSKKYKVIISGEGADEVFNGYAHHHTFFLLNKYNLILKIIVFPLQFIPVTLLNKLHPYPKTFSKNTLKRILNNILNFKSTNHCIQNFISIFTKEDFDKYLNPDFLKKMKNSKTLEEKGDFFDKLTVYDIKNWNTKYTLLRCDKISMAHSIETRVPFLDHNLVEQVINTRVSDRIGLFKQKTILRKVMQSIQLPKSIVNRKKKPFLLSLKKRNSQNDFQNACEKRFNSTTLNNSNIWRAEAILSLVDKKESRSFLENKKLCSILIFDHWVEEFLKRGMSL